MYGFTAQDAREIVAQDAFSSRGYVIDQITKAARNGQTSITIPTLRLSEIDSEQFKSDGFTVEGNTISWKA